LFFNEYIREAKRSAIFTQERSQGGEKRGSFTHEQYIICSQTQLDNIAHWQTVICRSHGGLSANEKEEKFASNDNSNKHNKVNNQSNRPKVNQLTIYMLDR